MELEGHCACGGLYWGMLVFTLVCVCDWLPLLLLCSLPRACTCCPAHCHQQRTCPSALLPLQSDGGLTSVRDFSGHKAILSGPAGGRKLQGQLVACCAICVVKRRHPTLDLIALCSELHWLSSAACLLAPCLSAAMPGCGAQQLAT